MPHLRQFRAIVGMEIRAVLRDKQALAILFAMPAALILLLSLALTNVYTEKAGEAIPTVLVNHDGKALAAAVERRLRSRPELRFVEPEPAGKVKALLRIPDGFSDDLDRFIDEEGMEPFGENKIVWKADPTLDAAYRWHLKSAVAVAVLSAILDELAAEEDEEDVSPEVHDARTFIREEPRDSDSEVIPTPLQQSVPGWSLFAMFFIAIPMSYSFVRERQTGTLARLLTYSVSKGAIALGKLLPYFLVNLLQFAVMLLVGMFLAPLFGTPPLELGSNWGLLVPVTVVASFAATSYGAFLATIARTAERSGALAPTSVVIMALLGGVMVPHFVMPGFMKALAYLSPLYWGHQAYLDVLLLESGPEVIAPKLLVLLLFALACLGTAVVRIRIIK